MEAVSKKRGKWAKNMGFLGLGLCALCCATPIIAIVGSTGVLSILSLYAERAALVMLIFSTGVFTFWLYKKRTAPPSCPTDCSCGDENKNPNSDKLKIEL